MDAAMSSVAAAKGEIGLCAVMCFASLDKCGIIVSQDAHELQPVSFSISSDAQGMTMELPLNALRALRLE